MVFADRVDAGRQLAGRLGHLRDEPVVVLGLPRGGIPVAAQVAKALIVFPGGFGTFDELFEMLTLAQTSKMRRVPIVLVGRSYWSSVINFGQLVQAGTVDPADLDLFSYANDGEDAWQELVRRGLQSGPRPPGLPSITS